MIKEVFMDVGALERVFCDVEFGNRELQVKSIVMETTLRESLKYSENNGSLYRLINWKGRQGLGHHGP